MLSEVLEKLKQAEKGLELLNHEIHDLESAKKGHLNEVMKGGDGSMEMKKIDRTIVEKGSALSRIKEQVGSLRVELETELSEFRKQLIEERQCELNRHMDRRIQYLRRIEELELEVSKYRFLVTGKKDHRLAKVKDPLPSGVGHPEEFVPIDEVIGRTKLEVSSINRMSSEELLMEYIAREKKQCQNPDKPISKRRSRNVG
jgi:hypothetical protein